VREKNLILLFVISFFLCNYACATGQVVKNPEKELRAEKIYIKSDGNKAVYKIKVTNISESYIFLGVKMFSDLSPDGELCEYSEKENFIHLTYTLHKIGSYNNDKDKTGGTYIKLEKNEDFVFSGIIEPKKCKLQADKYAQHDNVKNIPEAKTVNFVFSLNYFKNLKCEDNKDCKIKENKNFTLWDDETFNKQISCEGFVISQFIFEIDESEGK